MGRWKGICAYDGTDFTGWQSQPSRDAVQDVLESALAKVLKRKVRIHGSGRTDAGVHAFAQVFHFDADWNHGGSVLKSALRSHIPDTIQIKSAVAVHADFHARYSAQGKRYHYQLFLGQADPFETRYCLSIPYELDVPSMEEAGRFLIGEWDFSAFAAQTGTESGKENPVKDFRRFQISGRGKRVCLTFEASGFMYKMVRSITGTLLRVGRRKLSPLEFRAILESRVRTKDVVTANPRGLFLEKVYY